MAIATDGGGHGVVTNSGRQTAAIAAAASSPVNIKPGPGHLGRVLVTAPTTTATTFYDNAAGAASGTIIGYIPSGAAAGAIYDFQMPALLGIVAANASFTAMTVVYS